MPRIAGSAALLYAQGRRGFVSPGKVHFDMTERKERNFLRGVALLAPAAIIAKIVGFLFKLPLYNILDKEGVAHFTLTYQIYALLLAISYSGIPVALSRLVAISSEQGNTHQTEKYFRVAMPAFAALGAIVSGLMFFLAPQLARLIEDPMAELSIRVLSPAVFLCCVLSVYEGYSQGHGDMRPTALKQVLEVVVKLILGLGIAWALTQRGASSDKTAAGAILGAVIGLVVALPFLMRYRTRNMPTGELVGDAMRAKDTLASIARVSIPVTLSASFMAILTILDSKIVLMRLMDGVGLTNRAALEQIAIYSKCMTIFNLTPALIAPVTVSVVPAISAFTATNRMEDARSTTESAMKLVSLMAIPAAVGISVLARPIYGSFYGSHEGVTLLMILGPASFFACMQLLSTAILQANGYVRVPMLSFFVGGMVQMVCDWVLVGNPSIGIVGSPVGTLACYATITAINFGVILVRVKRPPSIIRAVGKTAVAAGFMGVAAWATHGLTSRFGRGVIDSVFGRGGAASDRIADTIYIGVAILVAVIVYFVMILAMKTITREDLKLVPKSEKVARLLRVK